MTARQESSEEAVLAVIDAVEHGVGGDARRKALTLPRGEHPMRS